MFPDLAESGIALCLHAQIGFIFDRSGTDEIVDETIRGGTTNLANCRMSLCAGGVMVDPAFVLRCREDRAQSGLNFTAQYSFRATLLPEFAASSDRLSCLCDIGH